MPDLSRIYAALSASGRPTWVRVDSGEDPRISSWERTNVGAHTYQGLDVEWTRHEPPRVHHAWVETRSERATTTARFERLDLLVEYLTGPDVNPEA